MKKNTIIVEEEITITRYGYEVYEEHPLAKIEANTLYLGTKPVFNYDINVFKSQIPIRYCVMSKKDTEYFSFEFGLDLTEEGKVWTSATRENQLFDSVDEAIDFLSKKFDNNMLTIFVEETSRV